MECLYWWNVKYFNLLLWGCFLFEVLGRYDGDMFKGEKYNCYINSNIFFNVVFDLGRFLFRFISRFRVLLEIRVFGIIL